MKSKSIVSLAIAAGACVFAQGGAASPAIDTGADRNPSSLNVGLRLAGTLRPRSSDMIGGSNWTLGCDCLDRDFADFEAYNDYIVPLGIKEIRLIAGWAKTERKPGVFDFAWLDRHVNWANDNKINVYLDLSYGNPIYKGAGGAGLSDGIPSTEEGLARWDVWIERLAEHFRGRIRDYAMWNEPNNNKLNTPAMVVDFNVRTARILRRLVPDCRLHALSLGDSDPSFFEKCMEELKRRDAFGLFDSYVYHGYDYNPDSTYQKLEWYKSVCRRFGIAPRMRQGENGAPSEWSERFALSFHPWSEVSQAKWDMRRMLGDLGHDVRSTVFTICDLHYDGPYARETYENRKGLLRTNERHEVIQIKKAYYAVQNVVSVFDDTLKRVDPEGFKTRDRTISAYEYVKDGAIPLFVFWDNGRPERLTEPVVTPEGEREYDIYRQHFRIKKPKWRHADGVFRLDGREYDGIPGDGFTTRPAMFTWTGRPLSDPVWIDLFTGRVYELTERQQLVHSCGTTFVGIPVYDSPCVITERAAITINPL